MGNVINNQWIEWSHFLVPNKPKLLRQFMKKLLMFLGHCVVCTTLDGCYFLDDKKPIFPLHKNCDCNKINIKYSIVKANAIADCSIDKFTKYVFTDIKQSKGKNNIYKSLGYSINDSGFLKNEIEKQALANYLNGIYILKNLDSYGQRLSIPIKLNGMSFYTGWMLEPEGKIRNATPFGGWIK